MWFWLAKSRPLPPLTGVGVAHDGDGGELALSTAGTEQVPFPAELLQGRADLQFSLSQHPLLHLHHGFTCNKSTSPHACLHQHTPIYITTHPHRNHHMPPSTSPHSHLNHHAANYHHTPNYITSRPHLRHHTPPSTSIHAPIYVTTRPPTSTHTPIYITTSPSTLPHAQLHHQTPIYITAHPTKSPQAHLHHCMPPSISITML